MDINETDKKKAGAFIQHLTGNPALQSYSALQREEQICQFLSVNAAQLQPTLSSPSFFQGRKWEEIWAILLATLYEETNRHVIPEMTILINRLDFTFFNFLEQNKYNESAAKQLIIDLLTKMLGNEQARHVFTGSLLAVKNNMVKRYVSAIFVRRKYIHFEITKVERLRVGENEASNMISLLVLMRPLIYMFANQNIVPRNTANGCVFPNNFTNAIALNLSSKAPSIPEAVFKSAMNSNASFIENNKLEASARLANILSSMFKNYRPGIKKDRGADTAVKSWINVARKNYKFYGYDIKLLDELYNIASDNGW
ncbi:MAG: hypothetical protein PQJ46_04030 [Spirochaetales bacterium]|nr:hypothetical protein [Spirochaetales bacterium]